MCGRFKPKANNWKELYEILDMIGKPEPQLDLFMKDEIRPTNPYPFLREDGDGGVELAIGRWGLVPEWFNKDLKDFTFATFNAKIEEAAGKSMFRSAFKRRHAAVPVDYFWEWFGENPNDPKKKQRQDILRVDNHEMVFAGIWDRCTLADGTELESFTLMTRAAGPDLAGVHTREPIPLIKDEIHQWIRREPVKSIDPVDGVWPSSPLGTFRFRPSAFVEPPPKPKKTKADAGSQGSFL